MSKRITIGALIAASILSFGFATVAQTPEAQVEERQQQMKTFGQSAKTIAAFVKTGQGSMADVQEAAMAIQEGAERLPTLFPEGTAVGVDESRALPVIWEEPDAFSERIETLQSAAADLVAAAETGEAQAVQAAFAKTGQACGACHDRFRRKEEN